MQLEHDDPAESCNGEHYTMRVQHQMRSQVAALSVYLISSVLGNVDKQGLGAKPIASVIVWDYS